MISANDVQQMMRFHTRDAVFVFPFPTPETLESITVLNANDAACRMLKYTREELLGRPLRDFSPNLSYDQETADSFQNDGFVRLERIFKASDGAAIPVEVDVLSQNIDGDNYCVAVTRDITTRKLREAEQRLREMRFKTLYHLSQMMDENEGAILQYVLDSGLEMTGSSIGYIYLMDKREKDLTLQVWSKEGMRQSSSLECPAALNIETNTFWSEAAKMRRPIITNDFSTHPCSANLPEGHLSIDRHMNIPVVEDNRVVLVAGLANKEMEYTDQDAAQLAMVMDGAWRIIQRRRMENNLREAKRAAEEANQAKNHFLANMSHELRTPLNGIMGMTQILMGTDLTPDQKEYLSLSLDATRHLAKVVTDLLSLSIVEAGKLELAAQCFDLHRSVQELVTPLELQAHEKSLYLTLAIAPEVPKIVCGDEAKLRQILTNLIFNAIKFTVSGGISLSIAPTGIPSTEENHTLVRFSVKDTGIGIPKELQEAIFESFTLVEDYMTKQYGGTGLGLSISQELASLMGGRVSVESEPGQGSTFSLVIPLEVEQAEESPLFSNIQADASISEVRGLKILLAEDEQVNSIMASRLLKKAGHHVTLVGNGQQAIEQLSATPFDLVLMDVQMPVVNGIQATRIIRSGGVENVPKDLPIIGLTAYAHTSEKKEFEEAGMERIVTKPYEADDLLKAIAATMGNRVH
ncbi:ATP-binding protein [Pseudodesulfovibrio sp. zrk46]|uniref:ATP-binding protein n=1 Tax=Pseudodesulfovibrio sp. zrk46 TaxID=2725288 RepID=UPI001448FF2A|nr:ATP-binding protein [Pseudodesulfovibrio sp. zrk46]QJB55008.1 response regulator [Pseudodesulfovibrio sp. zrk46]